MNIVCILSFCLLKAAFADDKKSKDAKGSTRLYGSQDAKDGQFPYTTFHIQRSGSRYHTCTGSLVGERWVLTAGHCVVPGDSKNHLVAAGKANMADYVKARYRNMPFTQDIDEKKHDLQERRAVAVYQHPEYNRMGSHDVGLVKVNKPFVVTNRVRPIPISNEAFETRSDCSLTGYGLVENNVRRYHLQYIEGMPARPARLCRFQRFRDVICLGDTSRGVCHGDSGGPLVCGGNVRGVASHGLSRDRNCGRGTIEQYYTDTERNGAWINSCPPADGLECYSCVKVSPPALCAKSCDKTHPPCKVPFLKSHKVGCQPDETCVAVTQVHVGKVLNVFGCYNCQEMLEQVPGVKCVECNEDLCNNKAPTSCDMV